MDKELLDKNYAHAKRQWIMAKDKTILIAWAMMRAIDRKRKQIEGKVK